MLGRLTYVLALAVALGTPASGGVALPAAPLPDTDGALSAAESGPTILVLPSEHASDAPVAPSGLPVDAVPDDAADGLPDLREEDPADEEAEPEEDTEDDEDEEDEETDDDEARTDRGNGGDGAPPAREGTEAAADADPASTAPPSKPPPLTTRDAAGARVAAGSSAAPRDAAPSASDASVSATPAVASAAASSAGNPWGVVLVALLGLVGAGTVGWAYWRRNAA